jgi:hypothetical protein
MAGLYTIFAPAFSNLGGNSVQHCTFCDKTTKMILITLSKMLQLDIKSRFLNVTLWSPPFWNCLNIKMLLCSPD